MVDKNDTRVFKTQNFCYVDDPLEIIVEAIAILIGNNDVIRKYAATLILKALLRDDFKKFLFEDVGIYPVDRNDYRVLTWKKQVLSAGKCEKCGATDHLEAHHIIKWAEYPQGRIDIENGECLCHACHTEEHEGDQSYYMMAAKVY